jgi:hypothetical protein
MSLVGNNGAEGVPKEKDALGYLRKVQQKFVDQPLIYNKFLEIMKDFKSNRYVLWSLEVFRHQCVWFVECLLLVSFVYM